MASIEILLDSVTEILRLRQSGHKPSREYIIGGKGQGEGLRGGGGLIREGDGEGGVSKIERRNKGGGAEGVR